MSSLEIVPFEIDIQILLHLTKSFIELGSALNPEMIVQECPMKSFDKSIALGSADLCISMINPLQLQKELIRMLIRPATEFTSVI